MKTAAVVASLLVTACAADEPPGLRSQRYELPTDEYNELNAAAGGLVLYELQVRTANACQPDLGADWQRARCVAKVAPPMHYRVDNGSCGELGWLESIKLGTLDDLLEDTADYRAGVTVRYVDEQVGANALWLMPVFPNNDRWGVPDGCDNLGSPYAVRDYLHVRGTLDDACIAAGRDEYSDQPCWGNGALEQVIAAAHARGMKVLLDVAFNHLGHNYLMYDYQAFDPVRERIARGEDLDRLWDFAATRDEQLVHPALLDSPEALPQSADLDALRARCPALQGDGLVRAFNMWRVALDWERQQFPCDPGYLEYGVPGFYLGADAWDPATSTGDLFASWWPDVKFLFHQEGNWHQHELAREREYLFRVLNYWVSRGVDGFRLDHTTDDFSGLGPNEWDYILSKVDYYAWLRGQDRPVFLAEEFHDQGGMSHVADVMTEGYLRDMAGRDGVTKDTAHVEWVVGNRERFAGTTYVLTALETHDEKRLVQGTGFDPWTGAGFWGIGASTWSTPMLLMGQERGEPDQLQFRKADLLRSRFEGMAERRGDADALAGFYRAMIQARLSPDNRALRAQHGAFLRSRWTGEPDSRVFARATWSGDGNVVFTFHNLWYRDVAQDFYLPSSVTSAIGLDPERNYQLRDILSDEVMGGCQLGSDLAWDFYVAMPAGVRLQWLRLEPCS